MSPRHQPQPLKHATPLGIGIISATWTVVVASLVLILSPEPAGKPGSYEQETGWPMCGYLSLLVFMAPVILWLWALIAWIGMKFFRHST